MKVVGIVLTGFGGLMTISGIKLAFTKYDLSSLHDLSKFLGAQGVSVLLLIAGIVILNKSASKPHT